MKKILSLVLAFALAFTMVAIPVMADEIPTAKMVASVVGEGADENGVFFVAFSVEEISSGLFANGQVDFTYDTDVATLIDYATYVDEGEVMTDDNYGFFYGNIHNEKSGSKGKFASVADCPETGKASVSIYIDPSARKQDPDAVTELTMFEAAFVLNEGQSLEDFALTITKGLIAATESKDVYTESVNGDLTIVNIKPAAPAIEYTDAAGITYKAVSDNMITAETVFTNAANGGALAEWVWVDKSSVNTEETEGQYIHRTGNNTGGSGANTMRTFFPIEGGKTYYVTNTIYNNTGNESVENGNGGHGFAGMSAVIATSGGPIYGTFGGLTQYSPVEYGGRTSWTNKDCTISGTNVSRKDMSLVAGYNKAEFLINAPAEATHIMISYGAHSNNEIYYGDFAIYEMEATEEIVDMVINYTDAEGNIIATETKTSAVGNTVDVAAGTIVAGADVNYAVVADKTLTFVSGGSTEAVEVAKVEVVTISYTVDGVEVGTATVEGVDGTTVDYAEYKYCSATAIYKADAGQLTVDAENLTVAVELEVLYEGIVSTVNQTTEGVHTLDKQLTAAGTATFDLIVLNAKDALVAFDNAATLKDNYFAQSSAYIQLKDGNFMVNDGSGAQTIAAYELGKTYSVEMVIDVTNYTYTVTIMDGETEVAKVEDFGMRTDVAPLDSIVVIDNGGGGAGALVVANLVVETEDPQPEDPTDEPTVEPETDPVTEPETDPTDEPTEEPSEEEPSEEPVELPFEADGVGYESNALGVTVSGKFVTESDEYDTVVVVISYLKDGKAYSVQAVEVPVINGEIQVPASNVTLTEGELTVAGISVLAGVNALEAITEGNLGTPVGSWIQRFITGNSSHSIVFVYVGAG